MDDDGRGDFENQTLEETAVNDNSAPTFGTISVPSTNTCTEIDTNLATSLETQPATSDDMDTTAYTTLGAMEFNSTSVHQEPVKESTSNSANSEIHIEPGIKQEYVSVDSSQGVLSTDQMDSELMLKTTDCIEKTVALKEDVATNQIKHITEQENLRTVSTEDMEVTATPPVTTDHTKMVPQSAVASVTNLEFVQKSEGLSSITQYRGDSSDDHLSDSDSDSDSSSSTSSSSSSSSSGPLLIVLEEDDQEEGPGKGKGPAPLKTQDEVLVDELPAVEDLHISLPEDTELKPMGVISSIVDKLVIVESFKDAPPLNDDSVIFSEKRVAIGKVFEVFGPVVQPFYVLRFNSDKDIAEKELKHKATVYFAPAVKDFTAYIFAERLRQLKGSDASWKNDQEPPPEALDYSDDEQEALAKRRLKEQRREEKAETDGDKDKQKPGNKRPPRREPRQALTPRPRGPPNPRAGPPSPRASYQHHLPNPHFRPPPPMGGGYNLHPPYPPPFQAPPPYLSMYPGPPPAHMPWPPYPFPGMFMPPPPPPPTPPPHSASQHRPN